MVASPPYTNGAAPVELKETLPVPPLHTIWVGVAVKVIAEGATLMVALALATHPFASVTL